MNKKQYITPALFMQLVQAESMMALSTFENVNADQNLGMDVKSGRTFTGREGTVEWDGWEE